MLDLLRPFAEEPNRSVVVVDFDGTLAPIVEDHAAARPLPGVTDLLGCLAARLSRVVVVSGRPVDFLRRHLVVPDLLLFGQYGLEWLDGDKVAIEPQAEEWKAAVAQAARRVEDGLPGLRVERKGEVAVTLHWRGAPELEADALALGSEVADEVGLVAQPGRLALELRPPLPIDKGTVAEMAASDAHAALVAGDDHGDLPLFDALDRLATTGRLAHGLRVGVQSAEAPPALIGRADLVVDGPSGLVAVFAQLVDEL